MIAYLIVGLAIWILCGVAGYWIMRADFKKTFKDSTYIVAWTREDRNRAITLILLGPAFLIASLICYVI